MEPNSSLPLSCHFTKEQWAQLAAMQDEQNILLINEDWLKTDNRSIPLYRAVLVEQGEAIDHYGFKWWKKQEPDMEQFSIELIDIFHFALADSLRMFAKRNPNLTDKQDLYDQFSTYMVRAIGDHINVPSVGYFADKRFVADEVTTLDVIDMLTFNTLKTGVADIKLTCLAFDRIGGTGDSIFGIYVAKYSLNKFRNLNGYKTGEYKKIWDGEEDNVHLSRYMEQLGSSGQPINPEEVLNYLEQTYTEAKELRN